MPSGALETTGNPVPVLEAVPVKATGAANYDVSADGRLVYGSGGAGGWMMKSACAKCFAKDLEDLKNFVESQTAQPA